MGLEKRYLTIRNAALVYVALFLCNIISGSLKIYAAYYIYINYKYAFFSKGNSISQVWYFWIWATIKFDWRRTKIVVEFMIPKSWWEKLIQKLQLNSGNFCCPFKYDLRCAFLYGVDFGFAGEKREKRALRRLYLKGL